MHSAARAARKTGMIPEARLNTGCRAVSKTVGSSATAGTMTENLIHAHITRPCWQKGHAMKKIVILIIALLIITAAPTNAAPAHPGIKVKVSHNKDGYTARVYNNNMYAGKFHFDRKPVVKYISTDSLTCRKLTHRKNRVLYIEVITGTVTNSRKGGRIDTRSKYNYISYKNVPWARKGARIRTYCVYSPYNNYEDDVVMRFDREE